MANLSKYLSGKFLLDPITSNQKTPMVLDILLDADALVALSKTDDTNHSKAIQISNYLQEKGAIFYISPFTISEVVTVLSYKVSHQAAKKFLKEVRKLALPLLQLPKESITLADDWFIKQSSKKRISYHDCYNMALLDKYQNQLQVIFSFDQIYKKNGFTLAQLP